MLELLDELMLKGRLDQKEQEALRFTAVLQICALAMQRRNLEPTDHELLALLLGRWGFALTDREQTIDDLTDPYKLSKVSLARALGMDHSGVEAGLMRLVAAKLIDVKPSGSSDVCTVNLIPALAEFGERLSRTLYLEFLEREGYELADCAEFYLKAIGDDIDQLGQERASDPRVRMLATEYTSFKARAETGGNFVGLTNRRRFIAGCRSLPRLRRSTPS